jgi:hypothetical protein
MTISAQITTELQSLQAQVAAASPLTNANFAAVKAMQLNAGQLVSDVQASLVTSSPLDTWVAPTDPQSMIAGFAGVVGAGVDQSKLSLMRGVVGRVASNLGQLV